MNIIKSNVLRNQDKIHFLFFTGAGIAGINTLLRPDFNLIIYLYLFYVWTMMTNSKENQLNEKVNTYYILIYSFIIDLVWILFWSNKWDYLVENHERTIQKIVLFFSWIGLLLKVIVIASVGILEWNNIVGSLPQVLKEKLTGSGVYVEQRDEPSHI